MTVNPVFGFIIFGFAVIGYCVVAQEVRNYFKGRKIQKNLDNSLPMYENPPPCPAPKSHADLVSFGNYLLSDARRKLYEDHPDFPNGALLEERISQVNHADIENWKTLQEA